MDIWILTANLVFISFYFVDLISRIYLQVIIEVQNYLRDLNNNNKS